MQSRPATRVTPADDRGAEWRETGGHARAADVRGDAFVMG